MAHFVLGLLFCTVWHTVARLQGVGRGVKGGNHTYTHTHLCLSLLKQLKPLAIHSAQFRRAATKVLAVDICPTVRRLCTPSPALSLSLSVCVSVSLTLHVSGLLVVTFHTFCFMLSGLSIILPYFTIVAVVFKPALIYDHASVCATPPHHPQPTARSPQFTRNSHASESTLSPSFLSCCCCCCCA